MELKGFKGPGNTFDVNTKWATTFPLGILRKIVMEPTPQSKHFRASYGLEAQNPMHARTSGEGPGNIFDLNPMGGNFAVGYFTGYINDAHPLNQS